MRKMIKKNKVLIIDLSQLLIRSFVTLPMTNDDGEHAGILYGAINSLRKCITDILPDKVIVVWDGRNGSARRKAIHKEYKAGRGLTRMTNFSCFTSREQELKSMLIQSARFKEYLDILPVSQIQVDNAEADDVIGFLCSRGHIEGEDLVIMSTDKDFLQLLNENVQMYNPIQNIFINEILMKKKYSENIPPHNFVLLRTFVGDSSDNISGIKGIGPKTALKIFPELLEDKKLTVYDLLKISEEKSLDENNKLSKWYKKVVKNFDIIERNVKLMALDGTDMLSPDQLKEIIEVRDEKWKLFNSMRMMKFFRQDKLFKHVSNISSFNSVFLRLHGKSMMTNKLRERKNDNRNL